MDNDNSYEPSTDEINVNKASNARALIAGAVAILLPVAAVCISWVSFNSYTDDNELVFPDFEFSDIDTEEYMEYFEIPETPSEVFESRPLYYWDTSTGYTTMREFDASNVPATSSIVDMYVDQVEFYDPATVNTFAVDADCEKWYYTPDMYAVYCFDTLPEYVHIDYSFAPVRFPPTNSGDTNRILPPMPLSDDPFASNY